MSFRLLELLFEIVLKTVQEKSRSLLENGIEVN